MSLLDVAMHNLSYLATWYLNEGIVTGRAPRSAHPSLTPSQLYRTQDGWIFIMCNKEKFFAVLAGLVGKPEWAIDPRFENFAARLFGFGAISLDGKLIDRPVIERARRILERVAG